ncbi:MAG: glycosyltransferase [Cytophagaceae bacterium]|nr:glycosyltransferase [Cytophagaceae bacterium]MBP6093245.1 glycosyltransferase [Cytophagaceae bacterium]
MKILHVLPTFCKGGGEKLVHDLANDQVGRGCNVDILCFFNNIDQGAFLKETLNNKVGLNYVTNITQSQSLGNRMGHVLQKVKLYLLAFQWFFQNRSYVYSFDIIHVHLTYGAYFGTLAYLFRNRSSRVKIIETNHSDSSSLKGALKLFFTINRRFRDAIVFELKKSDFDEFVKNSTKIKSTFIPLGTDCPELVSSENILNRSEGKIAIGQVGRLHIADRRTDQYVLLAHELKKLLGERFIFYMFGDGPDFAIIESLIKKYQLEETVILCGYTDDLAAAFKSLDLYVTINVGENCGVAGLQAIWSKVPTVAIQVDDTYHSLAMEDVIPNTSDLPQLASFIVQLLNNKKLKSDFIIRQNDHVVKFHSINSYCDETYSFYQKLFN